MRTFVTTIDTDAIKKLLCVSLAVQAHNMLLKPWHDRWFVLCCAVLCCAVPCRVMPCHA